MVAAALRTLSEVGVDEDDIRTEEFAAIENHETVGTENECYRLVSNEGLSRDRCHVRGRSQARRTANDGNGPDRGCSSGQAQMLQSSRNLPDHVLLLNLLMIALVMWPSFQQQVKPALFKFVHKWYCEVATIHAVLGIAAELLGVYIVVVAGTNVLPQWLRFKHRKLWMRTELELWAIVLFSGVGTYCAWYLAPFR
jgi:hypothetical protein